MTTTIDLLSLLRAEDSNDEFDADLKVIATPSMVNAMSSVLNYIITDAFDLDPEESLWVGYQLGQVLSPLERLIPSALMGAVQQELRTQEYSHRMMSRSSTYQGPKIKYVRDPSVRVADLGDWVESLTQIIFASYPNLRPMLQSTIIGSMHGMLAELGVTNDPKTTRPSLYLPTAVRYLLKK